jgi:hypothetical protein
MLELSAEEYLAKHYLGKVKLIREKVHLSSYINTSS